MVVWFQSFVLNTSDTVLYGLLISISVCLVSSWYLLSYRSLTNQCWHLSEQKKVLKKRLISLKKRTARFSSVTTDVSTMHAALIKIVKGYSHTVHDGIQTILASIEKSHMWVQHWKQSQRETNKLFSMVRVRFELTGSYKQFIKLLSELNSMIATCTLSKTEQGIVVDGIVEVFSQT